MTSADLARLDALLATNPDVLAACVLGTDGEVRATRGVADAALASLGSALAVVAARALTELGRGALASVIAEGDDGFVFVEPVDDTTVLAAVAHRGAAPGLVVSDMRAAIRAGAVREAS